MEGHGRVEVHAVGYVVGALLRKLWEGKRNIAVGVREGTECLCRGVAYRSRSVVGSLR